MYCFLNRKALGLSLALLTVACLHNRCQAHFPWLTVDQEGHALMYFSENPAERDYKVPEAVSKAEVFTVAGGTKPTAVKLETIDTETFKGRRSVGKIAENSALTTAFTYGNYHGTLLKYYAQHLPPVGTKAMALPKSQDLQATVAPAKTGIEVRVLWKGKPIKSAEVTIIDAQGETFQDKTDQDGKVAFSTQAEGMTLSLIHI